MVLPILPSTQATGDVDTNTDPPTVPLFRSQAPLYNQTVGGTTLNFATPEPDPPVEAGVFRGASGTTTIFDPGTGVAEGRTSFFGDSRPFQPIGVPLEPGVGVNDDTGQFGRTSFFGGPSIFQPIGIPLEGEQPLLGTTTNFENQTFPTSGFDPSRATRQGPAQFAITPQPNVLDQYASYTYQASVYLLTPAEKILRDKKNKYSPSAYNLLFQSGGAPVNTSGPMGMGSAAAGPIPVAQGQTRVEGSDIGVGGGFSNAGRNPFFTNDFYIDTITINNALVGKATQAAHMVAELKFTVTEPNGISLLDCLYQAVQDARFTDGTGAVNYGSAEYLMVIRFYGYDENGQIVRAAGSGAADAVVEKFIPFKIRLINWSVTNRLVTYEFDCAPIGQVRGSYTPWGSVPGDVQLVGSTVAEMLAGSSTAPDAAAPTDAPGATTTARTNQAVRGSISGSPAAPPTASAAPKPSAVPKASLVSFINDYNRRQYSTGIPDEYVIEFANGAEQIAGALVVKPGAKTDKKAPPMSLAPGQDPSQSSPDKQAMDILSRNFGVIAGQQIVQVIDQVISNSTYITDQAVTVRTEASGQEEPNPKSNTKGMSWYNIVMTATQLEYDKTRNDFAYRITYTIVPYRLVDFQSGYFPNGQFQGLHKTYPYWFTGQNTQVLDYQAKFDKLYTITFTGNTPENSQLAQQRQAETTSMRDIAVIAKQARSSESEAGAAGGANELAANAKEYLYNPGDNATAKVKILGDPAWIQQGSMTGLVNAANFSYEPFEPDGTINFDVGHIMFEIAWQRPEDYNLDNGLADPYGRTEKTFGNRDPIQSVIYRAKSVTSYFSRGKFEQELEGTLYRYPIPSGTNKAATAAQPNSSVGQRETALNPITGRLAPAAAVPGVLGDQARAAIAQQQARGQTNGLLLAPGGISTVPGQESGQFDFNLTRPADTVQFAPPPQPTVSNGQTVAPITTAAQRALDQSVTSNPAVNRRLSENQELIANLTRAPGTGRTSAIRSNPQPISRDP